MAPQSSSHHEERRHRSDRERERSGSSTHHNRTISSTTLLLVLSLVLAVLAVMLSLPSGGSSSAAAAEQSGVLGGMFNTPKRSSSLHNRESAVAQREAEVARREAEILVGAPGGVIPNPPIAACPPCMAVTTVETVMPPAQTIIKEVVREDSLTPPGWQSPRIEDMIDRELKIAERERDISRREEQVNRREHDASRRESWIMEQLVALGGESHHAVEEEYVYEPVGAKRKAKYEELPPIFVSEYAYGTQTKTIIQTQIVDAPAPANTRLAPFPTPEAATHPKTESSPRTTAVEVIRDEGPRTILRPPVRAQARPDWW